MMRILIVDDTPGLARTISRSFKTRFAGESAFQNVFFTACSGAEALDILDSEPQKKWLIISDYEMPLMNGIALYRELKVSARSQLDFYFVLFSQLGDSPDLIAAAQAEGITSVVKKLPIDVSLAQLEDIARVFFA